MADVLEWLAFLFSLLCVFCYGNSKLWGALVGVVTAALFVSWGIVAGVMAAAVTNTLFIALHLLNLKKALKEIKKPCPTIPK